MTSSTNPISVFSVITLALLKDTGWYDVDYDNANNFFYGKDESCGFLSDTCFDSKGDLYFE